MSYDDEISSEDVDVMLRYLQYHEPEHATREEALKRLQETQAEAQKLGREDPAKLLELQKKIDRQNP